MNRFANATLFAVALLVAACSEGPVADERTSVRPRLSSAAGGDLSKIARYVDGRPEVLFGLAKTHIGPAGGTIRLLDFEVVVPPGAVSKMTTFTIKLPADPTGAQYAWAEFGPHGVTFATPVTLRLPYKGTSSEGIEPTRVMWFNGTDWVPFATTVTADGRIQAQTNHFSDYGTEEKEPSRGITLAGRPVR